MLKIIEKEDLVNNSKKMGIYFRSILKNFKHKSMVDVRGKGLLNGIGFESKEYADKFTNEMLKNNIISGGMIPKINTCLDAISNGVRGVVIVDGRKPHSILFELFSDKGAGTLIRK